MNRHPDAEFFIGEIKKQLASLPEHSDVLAVGYLKAIYHTAATYGIQEVGADIESASRDIYRRLKKDDPVRVHYFISIMLTLPGLCSPEWIPVLEKAVLDLHMPEISQSFMECMKKNVEHYQNQKEPNKTPQTTRTFGPRV